MQKLDRKKCTDALNEGFVMIFGEQHRELLKTKGEELIELGMKNGKNWVKSMILKESRVSNYLEMVEKGIIKQEKVDESIKQLNIYFTDEEIDILKGKNKIKDQDYHFTEGVDKYTTLFVDEIPVSDVNIVKPTPFKYFKEYILNDKYNISLYGEGGLQLDMYNKKNLKYYQDEGELFYMVEDISKKYHYFGMLLTKDDQAEVWIEKIKNNIKDDYWINNALSQIIYRLIKNENYADEAIIDIQNYTGIINDGFSTHKQIKKHLEEISENLASKLPDNLFSKEDF